jgi:hypothetical protein
MNNVRKTLLACSAVAAMLLGVYAPQAAAQSKGGDEFFVISSIDRTKHLLVLLQATEITEIMNLTDKTQYLGMNGKPMKLTDVRSGDCVYVISHKDKDGNMTVDKVTEGVMTVAELRKRYVPYLPANAGQIPSFNMQPTQQQHPQGQKPAQKGQATAQGASNQATSHN